MNHTVVISSDDKYKNSESTHDFTVKLDHRIDHALSVSIIDVIIPNSMYAINSSNNLIYFAEGGSTFTATITPGNYTRTELETEIDTQMAAVGAHTYSSSISVITGKCTISDSTGNFTLEFASNTTNSMAKILGFTETDTSSASSHVGTNVVCLMGLDQYLYVEVDANSDVSISTVGNIQGKVMCAVPIVENRYDYIHYQPTPPIVYKYTTPTNIHEIKVRILNRQLQTVDINGGRLSLVLNFVLSR